MPPVKPRDMEDTWNPAELGRSLKESKEKRRRPKDGDRDEDKERRRKERPKDDEERKHRRRKEEDGEKPKERKDRERDRDKDKDRDKDRDREKHRERKDKDRDREKRHRDKENGEGETKRRSKDEDEVDGSRRRRRHNEEDEDKEKRHRRRPHDEADNDEEKRQRREERRKKRDEEGGKEKRSRDGEDREKRHRDKDDKEKRHRDGEDREKKHRDGEDKERRHKERDGEREHRRRRDEDGDERRRHRDENGERKHRDRKDREERDKDRDRGHRDREKRHEREKDVLEDEGNHRRHRDKEKEREKKKEEEETRKPKSRTKSKKEGKKTTSKKSPSSSGYTGSHHSSRGNSQISQIRKSVANDIQALKSKKTPAPVSRTTPYPSRTKHHLSKENIESVFDPARSHSRLTHPKSQRSTPLRNSPVNSHRQTETRNKTIGTKTVGSRRDRISGANNAPPMHSSMGKPYSLEQSLPKTPTFSEEREGAGPSTIQQSSDPDLHNEESQLSGEQSTSTKSSITEEADGDDYDYDDDDFEDYEEDFEEDDDDGDEEEDNKKEVSAKDKVAPLVTPRTGRDITSGYIRSRNWGTDDQSREEMDDILRAMDAENDRLLSATKRDSRRDDSDDDDRRTSSKRPTTSKPRSFINFVSAKQRVITNKASQRTKTRGRELFQIIELDRAAFDLFDMPPVREYELYIRTYGRSDTKQKYIQTNEDNIEKEIQTEEIDTREMWCQCPPEDAKGYGGETESLEDLETKPIDTVALTKFVQKAGQTMLILLEEDRVEAAQSDTSQKRSNICLSEAFLEIYAPPFLKGRCVSFTQFSEAQTHMMLTVYDRPSKPIPGDNLSTKGAICVWNVNETSQPQKILMCEGQPKCCCFSPVKTTLVFAGMTDGSIAVWDLREDNSIHKLLRMDDQAWYLRSPTYNTAGVLHYENHQSAVSSIVPIYVPDGPADDSEIEGSSSFQLASVEENAIVNLWVVAEILNPEPGGSESDLGLAPHGRVKLIKSSAIKLDNPARDAKLRTTMKAFEMQLLPSDPSHFYVGTDTGHIIHGVRFGGKAPPKAYKPDIDAPVEVTSLDFSPFTEPVFLAGCADGSIRLYHIGNPAPLLVWENTTNNAAVLTVRWCQSRPSVFFVVDVTSRLYIWDLLMSDAVPMKEEKISQDKLTSFCLSKDYASTGLGAAGRKPAMAVSFDDGRVEVHTVSQQFSALMPEEVDQFAQFLDNAA